MHKNEKNLHHSGSYNSDTNTFTKSSDLIQYSRQKSELNLYTDVRLYIKEDKKHILEQCIEDKICINIQDCTEPKCIIIKETLIEQDSNNIRIKDEDKLKILKNFFFYIRPKEDYIFHKVIPQLEEILVFYPSKDFNVFSLDLIFREAIDSMKITPEDKMSKQNWQNIQRIQEIMGELDVIDNSGRILHPQNKIQLR